MSYTNKEYLKSSSEKESQCSRKKTIEYDPIRVVHLHSTLGIYGAERWTYALIRSMDADMFESTVITIGDKDGADLFYKFLLSENHAAEHMPIAGRINKKLIGAVKKYLLDNKVDILHTHGFKADVIGYFAARKSHIALVSTLHGWSQDEGLQIKLYERAARFFLKRFDCVFPNSPMLEENMLKTGFDPARVKLIMNAVDLSGVEFVPKIHRSGEPYRFIFVGRLCRPKGVYELIEAFSLLQSSARVELMVVGDGPEKDNLVELSQSLEIADKILFTGAVRDVFTYMDKAHAFVLPSYSEGIPRVVMEAFAAGVPVISTNIPGVKQLITDKVNGRLVPVKDARSLATAMNYFLDNQDITKQYISVSRDLIVERFSAKRLANDYKREYLKIIARRAR